MTIENEWHSSSHVMCVSTVPLCVAHLPLEFGSVTCLVRAIMALSTIYQFTPQSRWRKTVTHFTQTQIYMRGAHLTTKAVQFISSHWLSLSFMKRNRIKSYSYAQLQCFEATLFSFSIMHYMFVNIYLRWRALQSKICLAKEKKMGTKQVIVGSKSFDVF